MSTATVVVLACLNPVTLLCLAIVLVALAGLAGRREGAAQALVRELVDGLRALRRR
jgi:hypothetical protein